MGRVDCWENIDGSEMSLENSNPSCQKGTLAKNMLTLSTKKFAFAIASWHVSAKFEFHTTNLLVRSSFKGQFWISPTQQNILIGEQEPWRDETNLPPPLHKQHKINSITISHFIPQVNQTIASSSQCAFNLHHLWTSPWGFVSQSLTSLLKATHARAGMNHLDPMDHSLSMFALHCPCVRLLLQVTPYHFYCLSKSFLKTQGRK